MNINKFTQNSLQAVQNCEKIAMDYGNQELAQEHLLYALLTQDDSLIAKLMEKMGLDKNCLLYTSYLIAHHHTYDNINEIDYQILVEADFLVNVMEDGLSKEAALKAYHSIFKTTCGKMICREMFDIGVR